MTNRTRPSKTSLFWRGATRGCPVCGQRHLTRRWLIMPETCPRCEFKFERAPGHYVGAIGVSTVITFGLILITMLVGVAVTYPDVPFFPVAGATLTVAVAVPIVIHPTARMMWIALDLILDPLHDDEAPGLGIDRTETALGQPQHS